MRGSPLFRALLTLAALLVFAWPLWRMTRVSPAPVQTREIVAPGSRNVTLQLSFLPGPLLEFEVRHLGKTIFRGSGVSAVTSPSLALPFPDEGIDLELRARWPGEIKSAAARVTVSSDLALPIERTAWSDSSGVIDAVLTFR